MKTTLMILGYMVASCVGIVLLGAVISLLIALIVHVPIVPMVIGSFGYSIKVWIAAMVVSLFGFVKRNK